MMPLKVSYLQYPLTWHDNAANTAFFVSEINQGPDSDLWILPEMFTSGFTMQPEKVAEKMDGPTISALIETAKNKNCNIGGSLVIEQDKQFYNRFIFIKANGEVYFYNKRHLFTLAGEQHSYTPGEQRTIVSVGGWKVCLQVCYDLRFPVFSRNSSNSPYDLLVYVANWPVPRINAWDTLLKARAIENQCYVIGVNRTGKDHNEMLYNGHSAVIDPWGNTLVDSGEEEGVFSCLLDRDKLMEFREKFPVLNDGDSFQIF